MSTSLLTVVVLSDGDPEGAQRSAASAEAVADEVLLWDRNELDWTDTEVTRTALETVSEDWILVLSAGETLCIADPPRVRALLRSSDLDAIGVQAGLSAEVRLHRTNENAMSGIGTPASVVSRDLAIAPPEPQRSGQSPTVSVIVATFNQPGPLRRCLNSLCLQTTDDFDVIVVNDGGIDVSDVVDDFVDLLDIRLTTRPLNGGPAATFNTGLRMARGEYALFHADQDTILPHHLALLRGALDSARADGSPVHLVFGPAFQVLETQDGSEVDRQVIFEGSHDTDRLMSENFVARGAAMFDRALAHELGGMNAGLEALEDWDFWIRMSALGSINYIGTPTLEYRGREGASDTESRPGLHEDLKSFYEAHPVETDSQAAAWRERRLDAVLRGQGAKYRWDHTIAVVGDGDLPELGNCLQSVMSAVEGAAIQLLVYEQRSAASDEVLRHIIDDATVCLYESFDETAIGERIERQAAGRYLTVLSSSQRLVANVPQGTVRSDAAPADDVVMLPEIHTDGSQLLGAASWAGQQGVTMDALYGALSRSRRGALGSFWPGVEMQKVVALRVEGIRSALRK